MVTNGVICIYLSPLYLFYDAKQNISVDTELFNQIHL